MKRFLLALLFISFSQAAVAGPFANKLATCLVKQTSEADKEILMQWIFAAMAHHPEVKQLSSVNPATAEKLNKTTANLFTDLVAVRCKEQTKDAINYEGDVALRVAFETLGRVAMQGIISNPAVNGYMGGLQKHFDLNKLKDVFEEKK